LSDIRTQVKGVGGRVARGEKITITRDGRRVAELGPVSASTLSAEALLARWTHLPAVDPVTFRKDINNVIDSTLP
jgi:antitoxin (DNA-binding transcriptional repressor) of toxin-antitoxin stability system